MDIRTVSTPLYNAKGWMKLVGVMMIIYGALTALSIIGIIIAWLPIWMGVLLFQSAGAAEMAYQAEDDAALVRALGKLRTYFTIMGVLTLIGIILMVVGILFGGLGMMAAMSNM